MADFATVLKLAQSHAAYSYAQHTRAAYTSDWRLFSAWCAEHQRRALPASPETILGYIGSLVNTVSVATIDRRLCGIAFHHRQSRQPDPTDDPEVATVLRGLRRRHSMAAAAKAPLTLPLLRTLLAGCGDSYRGVQERALLLLGFTGAFRSSELVALTRADLTFVSEGMLVMVRRSKTDQEGYGLAKGIPCGSTSETCPVQAIQAWLRTSGIRTGCLFRALDSHGRRTTKPLPAYAVRRIVQRAVARAGLDPAQYGSHSLRAGLVTAAAQAGVAERVIMQQTGHTDVRTMRRYIRDASLFGDNAAARVGL